MDYNGSRMNRIPQAKSKQYLPTVVERREPRFQQPTHSKRKSDQDPATNYPPRQPYQHPKNSHISVNSYQNRAEKYVNIKTPLRRFATQQAAKIRNKPILTIQNIVTLKERLYNIHEDYKILIQQQKGKSVERTQIILQLLDQMQSFHEQKVQNLRRMIDSTEEEKKQVGMVDEKMNQIKNNVEELISQSGILKQKNEVLVNKIAEKKKRNSEKQDQLQELQKQLLQIRNEVEQLQIKNIKNNKANKEIMQIFKTASSIQQRQ